MLPDTILVASWKDMKAEIDMQRLDNHISW